jgi:lipopolysaccharide export system protein LptA
MTDDTADALKMLRTAHNSAYKLSAMVERITVVLAAALVLGFTVNFVCAEGAPSSGITPNQPIYLTAENYTEKKMPAGWQRTYQGQVRVHQDDVTLRCDELVVVFGDDKVGSRSWFTQLPMRLQRISQMHSMTASGNVRIAQHNRPYWNTMMAVAERAVFDNVKRTIKLIGGAKLRHGPESLIGTAIVVLLDEENPWERHNEFWLPPIPAVPPPPLIPPKGELFRGPLR